MPTIDSENQDTQDSLDRNIRESADDWALPYDVRHFSELLIDGSDAGCERVLKMLAGLPSMKAAYLIATSITHPERIAGFDDLACLAFALDRQIKAQSSNRA